MKALSEKLEQYIECNTGIKDHNIETILDFFVDGKNVSEGDIIEWFESPFVNDFDKKKVITYLKSKL